LILRDRRKSGVSIGSSRGAKIKRESGKITAASEYNKFSARVKLEILKRDRRPPPPLSSLSAPLLQRIIHSDENQNVRQRRMNLML